MVYAKYQKASIKALVQVDFPMYALSKHNQNKRKKKAKFKMLSFCKKVILLHPTFSCKVLSVYIVYAKYQNVAGKALVRADFPVHALSMHDSELQRAITLTELAPSP